MDRRPDNRIARFVLITLSALLMPAALTGCGAFNVPADVVTPAETAPAEASEPPQTVSFTVSETPVPEAPTPTPAPPSSETPVPASVAERFSVVWVADTQLINELYPETLIEIMQWTLDNRVPENIRLLVHTGDIINDFTSRRQGNNARTAFAMLGSDVPFLAVAGNHDVGTDTIDYDAFCSNIASLYPDAARLYQNGRGAYALVETDEVKLLFAGIGWAYKDAAVDYLNSVLLKYPQHTAILCVHSYLNENGTLTDGGDILFEQVVRKNPNVRLVLCGHRNNTALRAARLDDDGDGTADRVVWQMLYNYQETRRNEGGGYVRILTFEPATRAVEVRTYSPHLDAYLTGEAEQFVLPDAF